MNARIIILVLLMSIPLGAQALPYKCRKADGAVSFQDKPCPEGSQSATINMPPQMAVPDEPARAPGAANGAAGKMNAEPMPVPVMDPETQKQRREDEEIREKNRQADAKNKQMRCARARAQLGALKADKPEGWYEHAGDPHYVADDRARAAMDSLTKTVAQECH